MIDVQEIDYIIKLNQEQKKLKLIEFCKKHKFIVPCDVFKNGIVYEISKDHEITTRFFTINDVFI